MRCTLSRVGARLAPRHQWHIWADQGPGITKYEENAAEKNNGIKRAIELGARRRISGGGYRPLGYRDGPRLYLTFNTLGAPFPAHRPSMGLPIASTLVRRTSIRS